LHHLSETQAIAFMLAHNKLAETSSWDDKKLAIQLKELSELALSFEIEVTGFELPEIDFRIQSLEDTEAIDRADDFRRATGEPVSVVGDIWHLGDHRLLCGNSLDETAFCTLLSGEKAAATFTDPPYNVKINGNAAGHGRTSYREFSMAVGEMSPTEFANFLTTALSNIATNSVPGGLIYGCMDWRHMGEMLAAGQASALELLNVCVWVKPNGRLGSFYKSRHELVFVFKNGKDAHRNNIQLGRYGRNRTNVWNYSAPSSFGRHYSSADVESHPTVKPVLMVSDAILDCTKRNDVVLDPFLGSGTTLLAAERTGRRCYGIELDPIYVDTTVERWQRMTGRKALSPFGETFEFIRAKRRAGA
jgi:DNA modification methylase